MEGNFTVTVRENIMIRKTNEQNIEAFFALLKVGLWGGGNENDYHPSWEGVEWDEVYQVAEEQSVVGLVSAGLDWFKVHDSRFKVPQEWALQFIGATLQLEQRNKAMNQFIGELIQRMRKADIYTLMVKGQAVAQCYERPLWRASGDIDLYLSDDNFQKAKTFFRPLVPAFDPDNDYTRHINMTLEPWVIEIHGNQYTYISARVDRVLEEIHQDLFYGGSVRSWQNGKTVVYLPSADNDVLIVFTHYIKHFFKGGLGLRQICDWTRLLWTYRDKIDKKLLEKRLKKMGLVSEWKAFGAVAVDILGMPAEAMPFYVSSKKWRKKAQKIKDYVMKVGNFGHNKQQVYYSNKPTVIRKTISFWNKLGDILHHATIFPLDSFRFLVGIMINGVNLAAHGE